MVSVYALPIKNIAENVLNILMGGKRIMSYIIKSKCDNGGDTFHIDEATIWSKINFQDIFKELRKSQDVRIITYSFQDNEFIRKIFTGLTKVQVLLSKNNRFSASYQEFIKQNFPNFEVDLIDKTHAKIILAEPNFVYLGSQNIEQSDWFQTGILFKDSLVYNYYINIFDNLRNKVRPYNYKQKSKNYFSSNMSKSIQKPFSPSEPAINIYDVAIKFSYALNWNQKFNGYHGRNIVITSYTLPNYDYVCTILTKLFKQGNRVTIYANTISDNVLRHLSKKFPCLNYKTFPNMHAKMVLVDNNIVWLSSQNLGTSSWFENTINIHSKKAYKYFYDRLNEFIALYNL